MAPFTFQGLSCKLRYAARRQPGRRGRRSRWPTPAGRGRRAGSEGPGRRSEVERGCRSLPTSVFCVVRARSAWGEEPEKVSRPLWDACRRATLRVQGAPGGFRVGGAEAYGMESNVGAEALRAWVRPVDGCRGAHEV